MSEYTSVLIKVVALVLENITLDFWAKQSLGGLWWFIMVQNGYNGYKKLQKATISCKKLNQAKLDPTKP